MLYVIGIVGLGVMLMFGALKFTQSRLATVKAELVTVKANVETCKAANLSLVKSVDEVRVKYKTSQDELARIKRLVASRQAISKEIIAKAEADAAAARVALAALEGRIAAAPTANKEKACEIADGILRDLARDSLLDAAPGK